MVFDGKYPCDRRHAREYIVLLSTGLNYLCARRDKTSGSECVSVIFVSDSQRSLRDNPSLMCLGQRG